ncbi:energy-coupling factor transporter ATP-binding protein EcfA2 [Methylobacterium aerolatum]|uniref:Energy-coupling factor transporter ATP-binding protein EcfA2 n=1 Tax=Methylobacterium aerolatum TaxID=418708 RepID=A0ABU0I0G2_9HYPH|nr:energy-coupling factor transporter ATP-binding protein EcfA2 [Methylobacterium aerolatum]
MLRLLDGSRRVDGPTGLGVDAPAIARIEAMTGRPNGLVLVTGPTGSGKTTTLYAALTRLDGPQIKVVTAEDPVEYRMAGINQVQAHAGIGLDFAAALRSILRQDPDVVMVGETGDGDHRRRREAGDDDRHGHPGEADPGGGGGDELHAAEPVPDPAAQAGMERPQAPLEAEGEGRRDEPGRGGTPYEVNSLGSDSKVGGSGEGADVASNRRGGPPQSFRIARRILCRRARSAGRASRAAIRASPARSAARTAKPWGVRARRIVQRSPVSTPKSCL